MSSHVPFSLLLPVHASDHPEFVREAFYSAVHKQILRPDHVIVVRDGPVPEPLAQVVDDLLAESPVPVTFVPLEHNRGLGPALDAGLAASPHDVVARMLANGAEPANVPEPLVYYRVGAGAYQRRGGRTLLRSELALQRRLRAEGFTSRTQYVRNVAVRGGYRLLPWWVRRTAYRLIVAPYGRRRGRARGGPASEAAPAQQQTTPSGQPLP